EYCLTGTEKITNTGKKTVTTGGYVTIIGNVSPVKITKGADLKNNLIKGILSQNFQSDIALFREAISERNLISRYILLYRLFESLFKNKLEDINIWIKNEEPNVQLFSDRKRDSFTIYTYVRDFISHRKAKKTPISSIGISNHINRLQDYVSKKIKEEYKI
ncbi:unnamed protein product, partial [marine sediment metagenome]